MKKNNVSEVVLTGVNIGDYKEDTNKGLINLLENINNNSLISRFRIF